MLKTSVSIFPLSLLPIGMDPKIRRDIWNLILRSKKDRVTIMTTHSMEEADILGDTIAIMANGKLKYVRFVVWVWVYVLGFIWKFYGERLVDTNGLGQH